MSVERGDLWRLYETHVAEYRFQVQLSTQRFQWYVGLDSVLLGAGVGLLRVGGAGDGRPLAIMLFALGAVLAGFTAVTVARQVGYQHAAREQARKVAAELGITDLAILSTPGWRRGQNPWWTKVRTMNYLLLAALAVLNGIGIVYVIATG